MKKWIILGALGALVAIVLAIPEFVPPKAISAQNACVANLEYFEHAKRRWAATNPAIADAPVIPRDLFGEAWTNRMFSCPDGGVYRIGTVKEKATCSLGPPVHSLSKDWKTVKE